MAAAAAWLLPVTAPTGAAAGEIPLLAEGVPLTVHGPAGAGSLSFPLPAGDGDYVQGILETAGPPLDLHVVGPTGAAVRRLLENTTGAADFRFIARAGQALRVTAPRAAGGGGPFTLTLTHRVPPAEQVAPPRSHLSPAIARAVRDGSVEEFWAGVVKAGTPLVEPAADGTAIVTFLWRGARHGVRLFGGPSGDHAEMERLGDSDIWFKSFEVPTSTRLSYELAPDVPVLPGSDRQRRVAILATAQADPLNRHPWPAQAPDVFNQSSVLELPDAPEQPGFIAGATPRGTLRTLSFASGRLGNRRAIHLYTPAGYDPARPDTVLLLMFDGDAYTRKVPVPAILDALMADGRLPQVVAAFIDNPDHAARSLELPANPTFAAVMAEDILPLVAREAGLTPKPDRTVLAGSSYGGLASAFIALTRPESFGAAVALSGSFWWHPEGTPADRQEHLARMVVERPVRPVRLHLAAGLFETGHGGTVGILDSSRHLRNVLEAKGYTVSYREYAAGHDYLAWRGAIADGLLALFGRPQKETAGQ